MLLLDIGRIALGIVALLVMLFCVANPPEEDTYREHLSYGQSIAVWISTWLVAIFLTYWMLIPGG